jgi:hypothetical protein
VAEVVAVEEIGYRWGQWMMMRNLVVQRGWCWWVGIELVLCLFEQKLLPLFMLVKDVNGVL